MRRWAAMASGVVLVGALCTFFAVPQVPAGAANSKGQSPWAGFVLEDTSPTNLTSATGSWVVPQVTCKAGETSRSSEWVGLGGSFLSFFQRILSSLGGDARFEPLYQARTESDCSEVQATYGAWEEVYARGVEKPEIPLNGAVVDAGDTVSVTLVFDATQHTGSKGTATGGSPARH